MLYCGMTFDDRKKPEDEYIQWFLSVNPGYVRNDPGTLPDITKPDGRFIEIKVIESERTEYNYVVQCHGFNERYEIDEWYEDNMLEHIDFKFICPDKILLIAGLAFWKLIEKCYINKEKEYRPLKNVRIVFDPSKETSSGTAFYFVQKTIIDKNMKHNGYEKYKTGKHVYEFVEPSNTFQSNVFQWM